MSQNQILSFEDLSENLKKATRTLNKFDEVTEQIFELENLSVLEKNLNDA